MIRKRLFSVLASLLLILAPASFALNSNVVTVSTSLSIPESVSITLSTQNIVLTSAAPSQSLQITTGWQIAQGHTSGTIYTYFSALPTGPGGTLQSNAFNTSLNGGANVVCTQPLFSNGVGHAGQDCSSFQLAQNLSTDLNDSVVTPFTVTFAPQGNSIPAVGTYQSGLLVFVFVVA